MTDVVIESHFLPSLEYFCAMSSYNNVMLECHEHYVKQSYRNRCYILSSNGHERLTVPLTMKHGKVPVSSVQIDYSNRWQANFWRTFQSAYAKSPFFDFYADELHAEIFSGERQLTDLNRRILSLCLKWLGWKKSVTPTTTYEPAPSFHDLRGVISAKSGFENRTFYHPHPYQQVFGKAFVPNLSIIDLISCVGPHAGQVIEASLKSKLNK